MEVLRVDEIKNIKRIVNLDPGEESELETNSSQYMELSKRALKSYDSFEKGKVKVGRLKTLLGNVTYKVNFAYLDLFRTAQQLRDQLEKAKSEGVSFNESLEKEVNEFLQQNSRKKEYRL